MSTDTDLALPRLDEGAAFGAPGSGVAAPEPLVPRVPAELERLYDVPVTVSAVLGHARIPVGDLLRLGPGTLLELDRKVGEAVDILINDRLVARGEVVLVADRLGVTMTEIVTAAERA